MTKRITLRILAILVFLALAYCIGYYTALMVDAFVNRIPILTPNEGEDNYLTVFN